MGDGETLWVMAIKEGKTIEKDEKKRTKKALHGCGRHTSHSGVVNRSMEVVHKLGTAVRDQLHQGSSGGAR